jgi:hypothetical protein
MLFLQSHYVYQLFEKTNELVQAEIVNLVGSGDVCGLDLHIDTLDGQLELRKTRRPLSERRLARIQAWVDSTL